MTSSSSARPTATAPTTDTERKARRDLLVKWLRKTRKRRRTLSTLLMRGWSR